MKTLGTMAGLVLLLAGCNSTTSNQENTASMQDTSRTTATREAGDWIQLFDGKTTEGWHTYGKESIGTAWKVTDGVLWLDASDKTDWQTTAGGDIVSSEAFEDFHLKLEWKISENGNSGIMFYVQEDTSKYPYPWHTGPELQILHNEGHPDGKIEKHRAGDLYDLIESSQEAAKPVGEWNLTEIRSEGGKLDFYLNGVNTVSTTLWDDNWRKLVAGSKFKEMPDFGTFKKGKIALQDHGDNVWFRNIQIKRL